MSSRDAVVAALASAATVFDGALLGLAVAAAAATSWVKYATTSSALHRISHAPSVRLSDLRSLLDPDGDGGGELVVVRGQVQPRSAANSSWIGSKNHSGVIFSGTGEPALIVQQTQTCLYNVSRGIFGWGLDHHGLFAKIAKEQRSSSLRLVPFILVEGDQCSHSEQIHVNLDGSTHPLPLTLVYHHLRPVQSPTFSLLWAILGHAYPVAMLDEEKILPVGTDITALGICRMRDGALEIKSSTELPFFLSDMTKEELESDLVASSKFLFWSGILLSTLSLGILGYAIVRNWERFKGWKESRRQRQELLREEAIDANDEVNEDIPDGELCVVCLVRRRTSAFIPCGHRVCCQRCATAVQVRPSPKCPVCVQPVQSSIRIYDS